MIVTVITFGQNQKATEEITCTPPRFTGVKNLGAEFGEGKYSSIENYLGKIIPYPETAVKRAFQGTEIVRFIITAEGIIEDIKIINSVSEEIDSEITDALLATNGMWNPGHNNDKAVDMEKEIAIVFRLDNLPNHNFSSLAQKFYSSGAELLFVKHNLKKALKSFDKGIVLLPNERCLLSLRGLTRYEMNDKERAIIDWKRIKTLGGFEGDTYLENFKDLKGYAEMISVVKE